MHLLFEGLLRHEISLFLQQAIADNLITLDMLNERIGTHTFHYSCSSDCPSQLRKVTDINYKSAQMWNFAPHLPLLIADRIPVNHPHWLSLIELFQIMQYLMCPFFTDLACLRLKQLISSHHVHFAALYPNNVIPKLHFLVHLPQQIRDFGPSRHHACFRMESKHQAAKIRFYNFKNICLSVCQRYAIVQCALMFNDNGQPRRLTEPFQPDSSATACAVENDGTVLNCTSSQSVSCGSLQLKVGSYVFAYGLVPHSPFLVIDALHITRDDHELFVEGRECLTGYDGHMNARVVQSVLPTRHLLPFSQFLHPWPLIDITRDSKTYLVSKSVPVHAEL